MRSLSARRRLVSWCSGARQTPIAERYVMFRKVRQPSLIVHGVKDIVVEPVNAVVLDENLSDARLLMLPADSNGAQSQPITSFGEACAIRMCWPLRG